MNNPIHSLPLPRVGACSCTDVLRMGKSMWGYWRLLMDEMWKMSVWGGWVSGTNLEELVKREVVESFAIQLGEGKACEEPTDRNSIWCLGVASSSILFLYSLLLTVPSLLGSNSRNERATLLSYLVNTFSELHAVLLIKENIKMHVMTISETLFVHTYRILYCESNCLPLVQFHLHSKH